MEYILISIGIFVAIASLGLLVSILTLKIRRLQEGLEKPLEHQEQNK